MRKYYINYGNGGMGNALLAHVLYSCNQVDINFNEFFSITGNSHSISAINNSVLDALHLSMHPEHKHMCLLNFKSDNFYELLRIKMSYSKWQGEYPTIYNYANFFNNVVETNNNDLWNDFYNNIKDKTWPICNSFSDIYALPKFIQEEIIATYKQPLVTINDSASLLQFLTLSYCDLFKVSETVKCDNEYSMSSYFNNDMKNIPNLVKQYLGWDFNYSRSNVFYKHVIRANSKHLNWFEKILKLYKEITTVSHVDVSEFAEWEKAIVIAKVYEQNNLHPSSIKWNNVDFSKIIYAKEINYGKTI